jgi:hypothetical protein
MEDESVKTEVASVQTEDTNSVENTNLEIIVEALKPEIELKPEPRNLQPETGKVSALSLSSIRAKKELLESQKGIVKVEEHLPSEVFTETQMLEFWFKYAQRLNDKGHMIMESLLRISDPKLDGNKIIYELPNEGSKIDFEKEKPELLGYLRGHLHNHEISIEVIVNESVKSKVAFTAQDKFNRLNEINPNLEAMRKLFDLDI